MHTCPHTLSPHTQSIKQSICICANMHVHTHTLTHKHTQPTLTHKAIHHIHTNNLKASFIKTQTTRNFIVMLTKVNCWIFFFFFFSLFFFFSMYIIFFNVEGSSLNADKATSSNRNWIIFKGKKDENELTCYTMPHFNQRNAFTIMQWEIIHIVQRMYNFKPAECKHK